MNLLAGSRLGGWRGRLGGCLVLMLLAASFAAGAPAPAAPVAFAPVVPGHVIAFPQDSGAHPDFRTEWWYATGWLKQADGSSLGFQITFFRVATNHSRADPSGFAPDQLILAHAALSDPALGHLRHDQRVARQGFGLAWAKPGNTDVGIDDWHMVRAADGHYEVRVQATGFTLNLDLTPTQPPLLEGDRGYSRKGPLPSEASYYYSEPQLRVSGSVSGTAPGKSRGGAAAQIVTGSAWLDHEWSSQQLSPDAVGWDWLGANLDDGSALMAFKIRDRNGQRIWSTALLRDAHGQVQRFDTSQVDFVPRRKWRSPATGATYPVAPNVNVATLSWQLEPLQDDQELDSRGSTGAVYWEGAVTVQRGGRTVGHGYLELTGYLDPLKL